MTERATSDDASTDTASRSVPAGRGNPETDSTDRDGPEMDGTGGFSGHGWDDVDLDTSPRPIDERTAAVAVCVTVLYPLLVYSSITAQFPPYVNGIFAICALAVAGYVLTMPRAALVSFGCWSVVGPFTLFQIPTVNLLSLGGLLTIAAFWIPFGYAIVVWWVLRS